MDQGVGAAARLPGSDRKSLAVHALAGSETVTDLAARHGVSRKFIYQQRHKARTALNDAFTSDTPDDEEVLFDLAVTKAWLRQLIIALVLICRGSYRGVVEFVRDLLGVAVWAWRSGRGHQHRLRARRAPGGHARGERDQQGSGPVRHSGRLA